MLLLRQRLQRRLPLENSGFPKTQKRGRGSPSHTRSQEMFSVKPDAQAAIASFFAENPDIEKILRVYVTPGSCNGPMLSIMSDQVDPTDVAEEIGGITFCMDKNLAGKTGLVSVILKDGELVVRPERAFIDPSAFSCS